MARAATADRAADHRRLQGIPRIAWVQKCYDTQDAEDAVFLASAYGLIPDAWQVQIITAWLGRKRTGKWTHPRSGVAVPRQNGKNGALEVRELFGLIELGEGILHTAHQIKTSRKAFKRLKHFFGETDNDPDAKFPELNALVAEVRNTNGQEAIVLKDVWSIDGELVRSTGRPTISGAKDIHLHARGGFIEFATRTKKGGRGTTYDLLVVDEAQHLSDEDLAAIRPVISSGLLGNSQIIYLGTPPDPAKLSADEGQAWVRIRAGANKSKDLAWIEYGAPDGPMPDLEDQALLFAANPSLDIRHDNGDYGLDWDTVNGEKEDLDPADYARERFGWWGNPDVKRGGVIDMTKWRELKVNAAAPTRGLIVVDVANDLTATTIGLAADGPDRRTLVLIDRHTGTAGVVDQLARMMRDLDILELALTPTAKIFAGGLKRKKITFTQLTGADVARGCAAFKLAVPAGTTAHVNQPELNDAIRTAGTRLHGGVETWSQLDPSIDISPLRAASVAQQRWRLATEAPKTPPPAPRKVRDRPDRPTATATATRTPPPAPTTTTKRRRGSSIATAGF